MTDLEAIIGPRREKHRAVLFVERKVLDVDGARAAEDDHRQPRDVAVRRHDDVCTDRRHVRRYVSATTTQQVRSTLQLPLEVRYRVRYGYEV